MKPYSTTSPEFIQDAFRILHANREILVVIRFPNMAWSKDFRIVCSEQDFRQLLIERKPKDSVTVMKSFVLIKKGIANKKFIEDIMIDLQKPAKGDWLVIGHTIDPYRENWDWAEDKLDLKEEIEDRIGNEIAILEEPNWISDETSINAYTPDPDGAVRPGAY